MSNNDVATRHHTHGRRQKVPLRLEDIHLLKVRRALQAEVQQSEEKVQCTAYGSIELVIALKRQAPANVRLRHRELHVILLDTTREGECGAQIIRERVDQQDAGLLQLVSVFESLSQCAFG